MNPIASLKGQTSQIHAAMKYGELIANKESAADFTCGYCSAVIRGDWRWILDAHKNDGKRYIVQSDEFLSAFWS